MTISNRAGDGAAFAHLQRNPVFIAVLVLSSGLGPFAMQMFVPALPYFRVEFGVSAAEAAVTISASMVTIGVSTLAYGPLSDRFGRRIWLLIGLALAVAGSLLAAQADSIEMMILARVLQAAGASSGMVLSRAIVMDVYGREHASKVMAMLSFAMVFAPIIGQIGGGFLLKTFVWRINLYVVSGAAVLLFLFVAITFAETNKNRNKDEGFADLILSFRDLMGHLEYRIYFVLGSFGMATFFCFMAIGPEMSSNWLGQEDPMVFGWYFVLNAAAFMAGSVIAAKLSGRVRGARMIYIGTLMSGAGYVLPLVAIAVWGWTPFAVFAPMAIALVGAGISTPSLMAGATGVMPERAGAASGLLGFGQMVAGAVASQSVAILLPLSKWYFFAGTSGLALMSVLVLFYFKRKLGQIDMKLP